MPALVYEPDNERFRFLWRWQYTVFPMVISDPMFWMLMLIHIFLLYKEQQALAAGDVELEWPKLDWRAALVPTSLLTFFVVFYGGNCYSRFYQLHGHCMGISSCVAEWAYLIKAHFGDASPTVRWNLMRLIMGSMHVHYAFLGGEGERGFAGEDVKAVTQSEWRAIRKHNFLTRSEIAHIYDYQGQRFFLPIAWALAEVQHALQAKVKATKGPTLIAPGAPPEPSESALMLSMPGVAAIHNRFEGTALELRRHCSTTLALLKMPVPYAYYHLLKLLLFVSLVIVGYALLELEQAQYALSLALYVIICSILIGMQRISVALSDPFGDDDTDFDIEVFMSDAYDNAIAILLDQRTPCQGNTPEEITNPLEDSEQSRKARTWKEANDGFGLYDERETPRDSVELGAYGSLPPETPLLPTEAEAAAAASAQALALTSSMMSDGGTDSSPLHAPPKAGVYASAPFAYGGPAGPTANRGKHRPSAAKSPPKPGGRAATERNRGITGKGATDNNLSS